MLALLGATLVGAAAVAASPYYRIEIDAPAPLRKILETYLDLSRYQPREDIGEDQLKFMLATAPAQVTDLISTEGYFTPHTRIDVQDDGKGKLVKVTVDPGPRTTVSSAAIEVDGAVAQEDPQRVAAIRSSWSLKPGQAFRQEDWDTAKDEGLQALQKSRYAAARLVESQARIDSGEHDAQLSASYDSGPTFTLGELQINGTQRYPAQIIRNVNPLTPGEVYSAERLLALQRQIQNTPYFSNVIVSIDDNAEHPDMTPVKVQVSEFPAQRIRAGVGFSTDTGALVEGRYSHYNVFNRAWTFDSQLKLEQERQYGMLQLAMPPDSKSFVNSINTSQDRTTLEGVDLRSFRVGVKRARSREFYDTAYTLDYYSDQLQQENGATLPPDTVTSPGVHHALVPGFSWARRDVDDAIFPRRGDLLSLQAGFAVKGLLTDQTFTRLDARYRRYVPIGKRDVMIFRTEGGAVFTKGSSTEVPASLLFRAGGSDSVRGYDYQSIGNEKNGIVYPNKYLLTGSAEYQHWFNQQWGGAVFYDVGTTADSWSNKQFYSGTGVGVRWRSPVGVVNADLAYGVQRQQFRPHISLGIAF
ncbi:MAG TPA: autotransporter assembly complex family protein [Herbaspirillum sp.]